jgi:hypothetical protein
VILDIVIIGIWVGVVLVVVYEMGKRAIEK